jgi:small-conductance mechanosensitive channel
MDETLKSFVENFSPLRIAAALVFFLLTWGFLRGMRLLAEILASKFTRYRLFISSAYPVLRLLVWVGALAFVIFAIFSPPFNTIIAISASAGLAVGLGAQDLIKNVIAGILILMDRPFRVGDMIQVGDHYGEVRNIGLRSTRVQTFDDSSVTLPNSLVLGEAVSNSNSGALDEMVVVEFHLPANTDVQMVKELAREAAACSPYVYLKKPIAVLVDDRFDRTFLTRLKIKAYVLDIRLERLLASDITERLKSELLKRGLMDAATVRGVAAGN